MYVTRCGNFTTSLRRAASRRCSSYSTKAALKRFNGSLKSARKSANAVNEYNFKSIPLVPERLHRYLFSSDCPSTYAQVAAEDEQIERLDLPVNDAPGENLLKRMESQCSQFVDEYKDALEGAAALKSLPRLPKKWNYDTGWTKYNSDGSFEKVPHPDGEALFFDIEVCMEDGLLPTLAVAVSGSAWFSWCSDRLINNTAVPELTRVDHLIPLEPEAGSPEKRVIIGHNVAFDRARVREQYYPKKTSTKFWDTMSMSIPMFGMADHQLALYEKKSDVLDELEEGSGWVSAWKDRVSKNSLSAVHQKLCGGISELNMDKSLRDIFVKGNIEEVRGNFQTLVDYCANDVKATYEIYKVMFPDFKKRMPSPITWFGMFEMGSAYLPITNNWRDFYDHCEQSCDTKNNDTVRGVVRACRSVLDDLRTSDSYQKDPWMWAVDWTVPRGNTNPKWYQGLFNSNSTSELDLVQIIAKDIKTKSRELPRVFGLCYGPYPLFYKMNYGWGFLVPPTDAEEFCTVESVQLYSRRKEYVSMPVRSVYERIVENSNTCMDVKVPNGQPISTVGPFEFHRLPHPGGVGKNVGNPFVKDYADLFSNKILWASRFEEEMLHLIQDQSVTRYWGNYRQRYKEQLTVWLDEEATRGAIAPTIVPAGTVTRRGVHKLFMTASNPKEGMIGTEIKSMIQCSDGLVFVGADVDSQEQWLAATLGDSAIGKGRAGATPFANMLLAGSKSDNSDLHSIVAQQVGISRHNAKVLNYARLYGSGLQHAVDFLKKEGIAPKKAKELSEKLFTTTKGEQLNYAELRPTCNKYFESFLKHVQNDYSGEFIRLSDKYFLPDRSPLGSNVTSDFEDWVVEKLQSQGPYAAKDIAPHLYMEEKVKMYSGGFETDTFNYLEMMLRSAELRTPVLGCRLSKSLEPLPSDVQDSEKFRNKYRRSIINWVVQSSAVDFLHMLLLTMHWLIEKYKIDARYSISIHDEVRYVVSQRDKYRCALALHLSNAYVRAAISQHLGIQELPMSIAFFSQVDIDTVLRKEVTITVRNPDGKVIPEGEALTFSEVFERTQGTLSDISWSFQIRVTTTMASDVLDGLQQHLQILHDGPDADEEIRCQAVNQLLQQVKQELCEKLLADEEALKRYRELVWGRREESVMRTALSFLERKAKLELGAILLQGLLVASETPKLMETVEFGNALVFAIACVSSARQIRLSRLTSVVKILQNILLYETFPSEELEKKLVDLRNKVIEALGYLVLETTGIGHVFEILSLFAVNLRSLFDDTCVRASITLIMRRIEVFGEKFRKPPVIEISQIFSVLTDVLKDTSAELNSNQLSMVWLLWKQYFHRDSMSVRSVVVVKALGFMREHFVRFSDFITSDSEYFYNVLLDFAFSSDANRQNRVIEDAAFALAADFVANLPELSKKLEESNPAKRRTLLQHIAKLSYKLALKSHKKMCFGVISLGCLPREALDEVALTGARLSTILDCVVKFLETYKCGSLCKGYCIRPKLLLALVEVANNSKDTAFFDVPSTTDFLMGIEDSWLAAPTLCENGSKTNAELFARLLMTNVERNRCVARFLNYITETEQPKRGVEVWKSTCDEIAVPELLSQFVSASMSVLAKELIALKDSNDRDTVTALFAGICGCKSISSQLEECFYSVLTYFMDNFLSTKSLSSLSVVASLERQEGSAFRKIAAPTASRSQTPSADSEHSEPLPVFSEKITQVSDALLEILLDAPFSTVAEFFPCLAAVPASAFEDEARAKKTASLVEACMDNKCGEEMMKMVCRICERSLQLRKLVIPLILKESGIEEIQWRTLNLAAWGCSEDLEEQKQEDFESAALPMTTVGRMEVDLGKLLNSFSGCFKSEAMKALYSGLLESTVELIVSRDDPTDDHLLRFCCEKLLCDPKKFGRVLKRNESSRRLAGIAIQTILSRFSHTDASRSSLISVLKELSTNHVDLITKEAVSGVSPDVAPDLLRLFGTRIAEFPEAAHVVLKQLLILPSLDVGGMDDVDFSHWSSLKGIEDSINDLFHSECGATRDQMRLAWKLLPEGHSLDLVSLFCHCTGHKHYEKAIFLLEEGPDDLLQSEEVLLAMEDLLQKPEWIAVAWKLMLSNRTAFERLMARADSEELARSVFQSREPDIGAEVLETFWKMASEDTRQDIRSYIVSHWNLPALLAETTDMATIGESMKAVKIYEKLVVRKVLQAPFGPEAVVDRIVGCVDICGSLSANDLWNQLLESSLNWEDSVETVAGSAYKLYTAERKDLLPYFRRRLEDSPAQFIEHLPSEAEHILLKILESNAVASNVKLAIFDFTRVLPVGRLFSTSTFRLLQISGTLPWKYADLPDALRTVSTLQSKNLKCAFLKLLTRAAVDDERLFSRLITEWIPLEGAEPDEIVDAIMATENAFLWKHLLMNVFFVDGNPAAHRVVQWIEKNAAALSNSEGLLEVVLALSTSGDDLLPRLPSKAQLRQFKIVENVIAALLEAIRVEDLLRYTEKWMTCGGAIEALLKRPSSGIKEIVLLVLFEKIFERVDPDTLEQFCSRHPNLGPSRQVLKTFLVVRSLDHLKKSVDDGRDPFMQWKLHCHAFRLCSAVLLRSKAGKTRHAYFNNVFLSGAVWERIAGDSSVVGISFGDEFTAESGIRKRKMVADDEELDDHDFTKAQPSAEAADTSDNKSFDFETHPCLPKLVALANRCLAVASPQNEEDPPWLKTLKNHLDSDKPNLNLKVMVLRFVQICGENLKDHRSLLSSIVSNCLFTILHVGASIECVFIKDSFSLCRQIDQKFTQLIFNNVFSSITNPLRKEFLKLFAKFYNPVQHQISLLSLEDALSPAVQWCRYEASAVFYRHNQNYGVLDVHRVNWKDTIEQLSDGVGDRNAAYLKKSVARMTGAAIGMAERMGYWELLREMKSLALSHLRTGRKSEEMFRLVDAMSEEYAPIVEEFTDDILLGVKRPNCRFHCLRLLKTLVSRSVLDPQKILDVFSLDLNAPSRLLLLAVVKAICCSDAYDFATQECLLSGFLRRGPETDPSAVYLQDIISIFVAFPAIVTKHLETMWPTLNDELKQILVDEWITKNDVPEEGVSEPELALRISVGNRELMKLFGRDGDLKAISKSFSQFISEEPQVALDMLPSKDTVFKRCVGIATADFFPRLAWKLMDIMDSGSEDFQEIADVYGIPERCQSQSTLSDAHVLQIARNCRSPQAALVYLRRCSSFVDDLFEGHGLSPDALPLVRSLAAVVTEKWSDVRMEDMPYDLSRVEVEIFSRAQLEKDDVGEDFWSKMSPVSLFEAQQYLLQHRVQQLDIGNEVFDLLENLKYGIERVWVELDAKERICLLTKIRAVSDSDAVIHAVSHENPNSKITKLCSKWTETPRDRTTVLRRIRLLKAMTQLSTCSVQTYAVLASTIAKHLIQLLRTDIIVVDPQTDRKVSFSTKERKIDILKELRRLLPGCEATFRDEFVLEVEKIAGSLIEDE
ncbi:hypothetical protein QR680_019122 [Steinernema hermaphroditum]|uniref:DNA-directed DNA polymerase n=1 Tax=Steinernema hermaphroditum TaxID=289476 RepID=A0AA39HM64_9BILA|nr:hypothetical protein QR680_019122 [Steinernema hermaphroditum]